MKGFKVVDYISFPSPKLCLAQSHQTLRHRVDAIASSDSTGTSIATLLNDGTLSRVEVAASVANAEPVTIVTSATFNRPYAFDISSSQLFASSDNGNVYAFSLDDPRENRTVVSVYMPLAVNASDGKLVIGATGRVLVGNTSSQEQSSNELEALRLPSMHPAWCGVFGRFRDKDVEDLAVAQESQGVFVGSLEEYRSQHPVSAFPGDVMPKRLVVADLDADGRDELLFVVPSEHRITCLDWMEEDRTWTTTRWEIAAPVGVCRIRAVGSTPESIAIAAAESGKVYQLCPGGEKELLFSASSYGKIRCFAGFMHQGRAVIVTAHYSQLLFWERVSLSELDEVRQECRSRSQAGTRRAHDAWPDNPYDRQIDAAAVAAPAAELAELISDAGGRVVVLNGLPRSGKSGSIDAACQMAKQAYKKDLKIVRIPLHPVDSRKATALWKKLASHVCSHYGRGVPANVRNRAVNEGTPKRLEEMFRQMVAHLKTTDSEQVVVVLDHAMADGCLLADLICDHNVEPTVATTLAKWAETYGPFVQFIVVNELRNETIVGQRHFRE